jgi:hypothetical protein
MLSLRTSGGCVACAGLPDSVAEAINSLDKHDQLTVGTKSTVNATYEDSRHCRCERPLHSNEGEVEEGEMSSAGEGIQLLFLERS